MLSVFASFWKTLGVRDMVHNTGDSKKQKVLAYII